jgi:hypothetical protein
MPITYEPIATTTLSSAAANITFSSIPATYTDLKLVTVTTTGSTDETSIRLNSDSSNSYSYTRITGTGSAAGSARVTNANRLDIDGGSAVTDSTPGLRIVDIFSYAGSTNKTMLVDTNADRDGAGGLLRSAGLWRNTSAVTSITIFTAGGTNLATGTTATLYGIKNA